MRRFIDHRSMLVLLAALTAWRAAACQVIGGIDEFQAAAANDGGPVDGNADGGGGPRGATGQPCLRDDQCPERLCLPVGRPTEPPVPDAGPDAAPRDAGPDAAPPPPPPVVDPSLTGNVCTTQCTTTADCVSGWSCDHQVGLELNICRCSATPERCDGKDNDCNGKVDDTYDLATDSNNCGKCGHTCIGGTTCIGGVCSCGANAPCEAEPNTTNTCVKGACRKLTLVAKEESPVTSITSDGNTVAWLVNTSDGEGNNSYTLRAAPAGGAGAVQAIATNSTNADALVQDGGFAYWLESNGSVLSVPLVGGRAATTIFGSNNATRLRVVGGKAFVADSSAISMCPTAGCTTALKFAGPIPGGVDHLAADAQYLYVAGNTIQRISIQSALVEPIYAQNPSANAFALDDANTYWSSGNHLYTSPKVSTAPPAREITSNANGASGCGAPIAVAGGKVYCRKPDDALGFCPVSGCTATPDEVMKGKLIAMTADAKYIYFATDTNIYRMTP